jgi:anti-sigma factor RsiW
MNGRELTCRELVELVTDYIEGRLMAADRTRFEAHLAICQDCAAYVEQMRETVRAAGRKTGPGLSAEVRGELLRAFRDWRGER